MSESPPQWIEPETEGESRLAIDLLPAASKKSRLWFFVHGLNSSRRGEKAVYFARRVARTGEAFASIDLTGHGDSEGDLRGLCLSRNIRDLARGISFCEAKAGPFGAIHLMGSSMGGLTTLWYSSMNPGRVKANVVFAPAFEMAGRFLLGVGKDRAREWRREGKIHIQTDFAEFDLAYAFVEDESRYRTGELMRSLKTPTLIIHGSEDETVPCMLSRQFAARVESVELKVLEGGDHRLTAYKEELFDAMWSFVGPGPDCPISI